MEKIAIRPVRLEDAEQIAEIQRYYVEETTVVFDESALTAHEMAMCIQAISSEWPYYVAERNGTVIGYCYVHPWKERPSYRHTLETTVYLRHGEESRGVGRMLMERLISECSLMEEVHALIACITAENDRSVRFHASLGFREVSHFIAVGRKFGRWLDVVDMELLI